MIMGDHLEARETHTTQIFFISSNRMMQILYRY